MQPRQHFKPEVWHQIYHAEALSAPHKLFRRVTDVTYYIAQPLIHSGQRWLELGCGTGELCRKISKSGAYIIGIDKDESMVRWAYQQSRDTTAVQYLIADATKTPLHEQSVNGLVAASLTGCLKSIDMLWSDISRILVPGGYAVLSFTNKNNIFLGVSNKWYKRCAGSDPDHPCQGTFHRYDESETKRSALDHNLAIHRIYYFNCFLYPEWKGYSFDVFQESLVTRIIHFILSSVCRHFILVVQRQ